VTNSGFASLVRRELPLVAASISVLSWGVGPLIIRGITASTPTVTITRLALSIPIMSMIAWRTGGRLNWALLRATAVPGVFFFSSMALSFESIRQTSIANQTLIGALSPALILLFAPKFLNETVKKSQVALAAVGLGGISLVVIGASDGGGASLYGDLLALCAMAMWSTYIVITKLRRNAGVNSWAYLAGNFTWSAFYCIPWAFVAGFDLGDFDKHDWFLMCVMVIAQGITAHGLHAWSLKHIDATFSTLMSLGCPVISATGAYFIYHEQLSILQVIGSVLVLSALAGVSVLAKNSQKIKRELAESII
jgi:drug/metabolite transporter (DMT)-like permease